MSSSADLAVDGAPQTRKAPPDVHTDFRERTPDAACDDDLLAVPTVAAVIAAYNEQSSVAAAIESLLCQSRPPDSIFVVVNNATDQTFDVARRFNGRHILHRQGALRTCVVTVIDIGINDDKKVGALNFAWSLSRRHDYIFCVDADTVLDVDCLQHLLDEIVGDVRLGGVSAVADLDQDAVSGLATRALVRAQRFDAAAAMLATAARGGETFVLAGRCSLLRVSALREVIRKFDRQTPWMADCGVDDVRLTADLLAAGFAARVSADARSTTAPMVTLRSLHAQQIKWTAGNIRSLLELPWLRRLARGARRRTGMFTHFVSRALALLLVLGYAASGSLHVSPWWAVPVLVAVFTDVRVACSMTNRHPADVFYALAFVPQELYRTVHSVGHVGTWLTALRPRRCDHWAAQAMAERAAPSRDGSRSVPVRRTVLALFGGTLCVATAWSAMTGSAQQAMLATGVVALVALIAIQAVSNAAVTLRSVWTVRR